MREPIRVLHVITRMVKGGAQENTLANVTGLSGGGWESSLATGPALGPEGSLEPECLAEGVRMLRIPELVRELSPAKDLLALRRLTTLCRKERPHIVHTHTSKAGILGRIAARRAGVPVVVHTPHGHVFHSYEGALKTRLFVEAERRCGGMADRLVALTENERREHLELGIGKAQDWRVIHSGIDFRPFETSRGERESVRRELGIPAGAVVLGTVGRLVPIKGQRYLIEALRRLGADHPDLHLVIVGDGELRSELVSQALECGLQVVSHLKDAPGSPSGAAVRPGCPVVHFLGLRRDVPRLMACLDLFVLPSLNEGMGRVLVEAMAVELPCVASRVSGIPDVVAEGRTGWLVPPKDSGALAAALAAALRDPARTRAMGVRAREHVLPDFSVGRMLEQLEAVYRELLESKGIAAPVNHPKIDEAERWPSRREGQTESAARGSGGPRR
jgi:glycosyltransferase involved in cell wall biosynthesis